jgi:hypothetical protein
MLTAEFKRFFKARSMKDKNIMMRKQEIKR